jgi:hypothetical protein
MREEVPSVGEPQSESEWDDEFRLSIWAKERGSDLELRSLEDGTWQAHIWFDWTAVGSKSYDITSSRSPSIEAACADVVRALSEAGVADTESLDEAVARWSADLDARIASREESVTESVTHHGNEGRSSVPE